MWESNRVARVELGVKAQHYQYPVWVRLIHGNVDDQ